MTEKLRDKPSRMLPRNPMYFSRKLMSVLSGMIADVKLSCMDRGGSWSTDVGVNSTRFSRLWLSGLYDCFSPIFSMILFFTSCMVPAVASELVMSVVKILSLLLSNDIIRVGLSRSQKMRNIKSLRWCHRLTWIWEAAESPRTSKESSMWKRICWLPTDQNERRSTRFGSLRTLKIFN